VTKIIALILAVLGTALSQGTELKHAISTALKQELANKVGDVGVSIKPDTPTILEDGRIASATFVFDDFFVEPVLMDKVYFQVNDVVLDVGGTRFLNRAKIKSVGKIFYRFTVEEDNLAKGLQKRSRNISGARVKIDDGTIILSGSYHFGFIAVPFSVEGYGIFEQTKLMYRITRVRFVSIPLPEPIERLVEREINPIFDLKQFYQKKGSEWKLNEKMLGRKLNLTVKRITADDGKVTVEGEI